VLVVKVTLILLKKIPWGQGARVVVLADWVCQRSLKVLYLKK
jgi:hypothetical protein